MGQPPAPQQPVPPPPPAPPAAAPPVAPAYPAQAAAGSNGISIAAMVCGIVGLLFLFMGGLSQVLPFIGLLAAIVSVILGAVGMSQSKKRGGQGKSMAVAGLVCGIVSLSILVLGIIIVLSFLAQFARVM